MKAPKVRPASVDVNEGRSASVSRVTVSTAAALRARLAFHSFGLGLLAAVTIVLMRRFIFTGGIPAGTDMLGFLSRSAQYASFTRVFDAWSPSSFGYRHSFNFDNIMGAATLLTRSPMLTVKLFDLLTMFGAGVAAYALAWSWYRRRLVATAAGLLYMASQTVLTRWGSGLLNVEIVLALAPVMLLTLSLCLERFTLRRAAGFALTLGVGFLVRPDLVLYVFPFLVLYAAVVLIRRQGFRAGLANAARTLAVAVPGVLLLNAAWLVPLLAGYRVGYETLNSLFTIGMLSIRSLDWGQSLLGFGREIGYFNFTGLQTWYSSPWLPVWGYYAFAAVIPLLAYAALWWHRDRRTVFLVLASVLAVMAAPGIRPPLGGLYRWALLNVPVFGNLRDPNRWLVGQAIAYALLASLTIDGVATAASRLWSRRARQYTGRAWAPAVSLTVAFALIGIALVPVLPTFVVGLRTWHVTPTQQTLLDRLRDGPASDRVMSVPVQDLRFVTQGSYRGYEHDLGYESVFFTGRQDVGDGSWDQRSSNFVAYETTLLERRDPAFAAILASVGVNRVVSFNYPLLKQVVTPDVGPYAQQRDAARTGGLTPVLSNSAGTDYAIGGVTPPLSFRRNIAVVLGGSQGVAALADQPGIRLSDWAVFTADDVIETQGYRGLLGLIRRADLVLLADERPVDIAVEGAAPLAKFTGITSSVQLNRLITDLPSDQSAQLGSLNDVTVPISQPQTATSTSDFSVRSPQSVQIWARVLATGSAATIEAHVDGRLVGSATPATMGHGFLWVRLATVRAGAGTHQVTISAVPSRFGDTYEVQEARVVSSGALGSAEAQLGGALNAAGSRIAYDFDLADVAKWSWASLAHLLAPTGGPSFSLHQWKALKGTATAVPTAAPHGATAPRFTARAPRRFYTFAEIHYKKAQDWAGRPYVYLQIKGSASGKLYQLVFDFGLGPRNEARYTFVDRSRGWQTLAFPTSNPGPGSGRTAWSHVYSVRVALPHKLETGTIALGVPRTSRVIRNLTVPLPILPGTGRPAASTRAPACFGGTRARPASLLLPRRTLVVPVSSLTSSCRFYVPSRAGYRQLPAIAVRAHSTGMESWSYSFSAHQPGVLVWTQAYDSLWRLSGAGIGGTSLPVLSLLNGYLVSPGDHSGTIAFTGESSAIAGVLVTVLAALVLLLAILPFRYRARPPRGLQRIAAKARNGWPGITARLRGRWPDGWRYHLRRRRPT